MGTLLYLFTCFITHPLILATKYMYCASMNSDANFRKIHSNFISSILSIKKAQGSMALYRGFFPQLIFSTAQGYPLYVAYNYAIKE